MLLELALILLEEICMLELWLCWRKFECWSFDFVGGDLNVRVFVFDVKFVELRRLENFQTWIRGRVIVGLKEPKLKAIRSEQHLPASDLTKKNQNDVLDEQSRWEANLPTSQPVAEIRFDLTKKNQISCHPGFANYLVQTCLHVWAKVLRNIIRFDLTINICTIWRS